MHRDHSHPSLARWTRLLSVGWCIFFGLLRGASAAPLPRAAGPWRAAGEAEAFDQKTIWQAINGAAELYIAYGFRSLRQREYRHGRTRATVQVYDMGSPINAFGVYTRERPPTARPLAKVGAAAAVAVQKVQCLAYKGRHYLRAQAIEGAFDPSRCTTLLRALTPALAGDAAPPTALGWLPATGQTTGSLAYAPQSFLGLRELSRCVHATYEKRARRHRVFVVLAEPGKGIDAAWRRLASGRWQRSRRGKLELLSREIPYRGTVAVAKSADGQRIYGVAELGDLAATAARLSAVVASTGKQR